MATLTAREEIFAAIEMVDASRPRSMQKEIGVSAIGGCRRAVYFQLHNQPKENKPDILEAMMGTAVHDMFKKSLDAYSMGTYLTEYEVNYKGLLGHSDWYRKHNREIVDLKTMKLKNAGWFPKERQWWQVDTYGFMVEEQGEPIETVTLIAFMRDGNSRDVLDVSKPYDRNNALKALDWLADVQQMTEAPAPEMPADTFCQFYCEYFGSACKGMSATTRRKWK